MPGAPPEIQKLVNSTADGLDKAVSEPAKTADRSGESAAELA
jgi:hypothetical protein